MTTDDAPRFASDLGALGEALDTPLSESRITLYFRALEDFPLDAVEAAIGTAIRACRYFPKPVELRELIAGSPADRPGLAWTRVLAAIRHHGGNVSVDFGDLVAHYVIEHVMGGWEKLALLPADPQEQRFTEAQFVKAYALHSRKLVGLPLSYLPGRFETENRDRRGTFSRGPGDYTDTVLRLGPDGRTVLARVPALPEGPRRVSPDRPPLELGE